LVNGQDTAPDQGQVIIVRDFKVDIESTHVVSSHNPHDPPPSTTIAKGQW
jgi:hypothetical protein